MRTALVFAAGFGTRLRPLTDHRPKALVEIDGVPMLERVVRRLEEVGTERIVVNVHPFREQIQAFVERRPASTAEIVLSVEEERPLETGGGLLHARPLLHGATGGILVHNVDVLSTIDLRSLREAHERTRPLATLAVMARESTRQLLFDDAGLLGRVDRTRDLELRVRPSQGTVRELAFSGIHVCDPALLEQIEERGVFSIRDPWLRLAREGGRIAAHRVDGAQWRDIGRP